MSILRSHSHLTARWLTTRATVQQQPSKLTLYTGTDCQLCDAMKYEIEKASQHHPVELSTYNIRDDTLANVKYWRRKYQYDIPVLHLNGQEIFRHRVTQQELLDRLVQHKRQPDAS